ncbi:MAG: hypothetical protein ACLTBV_21025 [Enterocloster bolteae]
MERIRMKDLPYKDRPYEKCLSLGSDSLYGQQSFWQSSYAPAAVNATPWTWQTASLALGSPGDGLLGLLHHSLDELAVNQVELVLVKGIQLLCIGELSKRDLEAEVSASIPLLWHSPERDCRIIIWKICAIWSRRKSGSCF